MNERFIRQLGISQIGEAGQRKLKNARVTVIGAGGLGSPVITYLACAGVGSIRVIDSDVVAFSNLNRQFLHSAEGVGKNKAVSAMEFVKRFADDCKVEVVQARLEGINAVQLLGDADVVVSCVDNLQTRLLLSAAALEKDIPLVDGGIDAFYGYVTAVHRGSACLACIGYGDAPESKEFFALGAVAGTIGSLQALEVIKILLGLKEVAYNKMIFFDGLRLELETLKTQRNKECPLCGKYEKSGE